MKKALLNDSTFLLGLKLDQNRHVIALADTWLGTAKTKRQKERRQFLVNFYNLHINPADYESHWEQLNLVSPSIIERALKSGDLSPDRFEDENGTVVPVYFYEGVLQHALENGWIVEKQRERTQEVVHQWLETETYYETADAVADVVATETALTSTQGESHD
jgi:hypothetical protein